MTKLQEILRNRVRAHQMHHCIMSYYDDHCVKLNEDAADALDAAEAEIATLKEERDRIERNRDMWKGQCERQAEQLSSTQLPAVAEDVVERIKQLLGKYPGELGGRR